MLLVTFIYISECVILSHTVADDSSPSCSQSSTASANSVQSDGSAKKEYIAIELPNVNFDSVKENSESAYWSHALQEIFGYIRGSDLLNVLDNRSTYQNFTMRLCEKYPRLKRDSAGTKPWVSTDLSFKFMHI